MPAMNLMNLLFSALPSLIAGTAFARPNLSISKIKPGMVIMVPLGNLLEDRCAGPLDKPMTRWAQRHPMIVTSVDAAKAIVRVVQISNKLPVTPHVDVRTLAPSLGLTGQIFVGEPCTITLDLTDVFRREGLVGLSVTEAEMRAIQEKIRKNMQPVNPQPKRTGPLIVVGR
ncbi:hypothetical protein Hypma_009934 [Hypsizygus marmoreus]|uniref:Uncharacterized protein n=1 Tax=Hypsizygus marmoreus TaxID=39966 RepID=A0A369JLM3_HYPMA|nr:hypothetical protein Hypma_009934 [Hypsizygus marmoreus]